MNSFVLSDKKDLANFLNQRQFNKIFILGGKNSFIASGAKKLLVKYLENKTTYYYFKTSPFPEILELKNIILKLKKFSPDLIVAVGGGSVLDYAKIANAIENTNNLSKKIINSSYSIKNKFTKLVAIPTTAGSGAEVTSNAVIYVNKIKYSVEGEIIKPDYYFLIPELIIKSSKKIKSSAGFDAIAQSVESLISKKSNSQSINFAKKSLNISLKNYLNYIKRPSLKNTAAMCIAANLSGKAINISKTTAPHAVSYPFTSIYNISHGHAVSLTLEKFLKFNFLNQKKATCSFDLNLRYKNIFKIFNVNNIYELEHFFINFKNKSGLESNFKKLKIDLNRNINQILSGVNIQRLKNNPINLDKKDIKNIIIKFN